MSQSQAVASSSRPHATSASSAWTLNLWSRLGLAVLYISAVFQFVRMHLLITMPYLNMGAYLTGQERLPFQRRVLPMLLLNALNRHPVPLSYTSRHIGTFSTSTGIYLLLLNLISFALAAWFCVRLHRAVAPSGRFHLLVFPAFLFTAEWSYNLHVTSGWNYPWDMPALAFFAAGLFCIYTRRFVWLLLIVLVGTLNRETTMFLIPLYLLDALSDDTTSTPTLRTLYQRALHIPARILLRTGLLVAAYEGVHTTLNHFYKLNDNSESFLRLRFNAHVILSQNFPQILSACAFLIPIVFLLRARIANHRFAAYLLILPVYLAVMLVYGALSETRIFGELCPLIAVAAVLLIDAYATSEAPPTLSELG